MITDKLFEEVLIKPSYEFNQLKIISGYASPAMAYKHIASISDKVNIDLLVGMVASDGMAKGNHAGFQNLENDNARFKCNYVVSPPPVHIKSYIWLKDSTPKLAFTGSGNYSQNAFFGKTRESFARDDPDQCNNLYELLNKGSLNCLSPDIETKIKLYDELVKHHLIANIFESAKAEDTPEKPVYEDCHIFSLLDSRTKQTHAKSGLNWGQRAGREKNQAYIPVSSKIRDAKFFPPRTQHFTLVTDDGESFDCAIAQDGDKAIETTKSNSILGMYFRKRLGLPLGTYVTRAHLDAYGRTDVQICKIDDETYFMDFSV